MQPVLVQYSRATAEFSLLKCVIHGFSRVGHFVQYPLLSQRLLAGCRRGRIWHEISLERSNHIPSCLVDLVAEFAPAKYDLDIKIDVRNFKSSAEAEIRR